MKENIDNEEEENNLQSNLIISREDSTMENVFRDDPDDTGENQQNSCCCCCCGTNEKSKSSFRKGWKEFLINEGNDSANIPFQMLTKLFINEEDAIEGLKNIRLNPNLVSENKLRNDLEFYIPQLCTFLLFGDIKAVEEFFVFLCKVCNASFFFAHRVHWFLSAMINAAQEKKQDIINILKMVNTVFKSPSKKMRNKIEKFYIANSDDFIKYLKHNNLYFLYDNNLTDEKSNIFNKINLQNLTGYQEEIFNKYKKSREIIIDYSDKEFEKMKEKEEEKSKIKRKGSKKEVENKIEEKQNIDNVINTSSQINSLEYKFKSNEFLIDLSNFKLMKEDLTYDEEEEDDLDFDKNTNENNDLEINTNQNIKSPNLYDDKIASDFVNINKKVQDINFVSYHSTINFIEHLCDISNELPNYPIDEQMIFLYKKIRDVNKKLPCNVYLPFLKDATRNYLICHIPLEGARIFRTKTRCPLMLTFEMIRIDEINEENKDEQENGIAINVERTKSVSSNYSKKGANNINSPVLLKDKITSNDLNENEENVYTGADYDLSKPVTLNVKKNVKKSENEKSKKSKSKEIKVELNSKLGELKRENSKYEDSIDNLRIKNIIKKFRQNNDLDNDRGITSKTIFEPKTAIFSLSNSMNIPIKSTLIEGIPEKDEEIPEDKKKNDR